MATGANVGGCNWLFAPAERQISALGGGGGGYNNYSVSLASQLSGPGGGASKTSANLAAEHRMVAR